MEGERKGGRERNGGSKGERRERELEGERNGGSKGKWMSESKRRGKEESDMSLLCVMCSVVSLASWLGTSYLACEWSHPSLT